jgi:hypothetical protein
MSEATHNSSDANAPAGLWVGLFAGPAAFLLNLQLNYMLVWWACSNGRRLMLLFVVLGALLLCAAGAIGAAANLRNRSGLFAEALEDYTQRNNFMAVLGLTLSSFFFLIVLAQAIPILVLDPCQP